MKHRSTQPPIIPYNAVYDVTEKDVAMLNYRRLQAKQALRNITKQPTKKNWIKLIFAR